MVWGCSAASGTGRIAVIDEAINLVLYHQVPEGELLAISF